MLDFALSAVPVLPRPIKEPPVLINSPPALTSALHNGSVRLPLRHAQFNISTQKNSTSNGAKNLAPVTQGRIEQKALSGISRATGRFMALVLQQGDGQNCAGRARRELHKNGRGGDGEAFSDVAALK